MSVTQSFDRLSRLLTRAVPGQGTESFQYSARGLTNYTGPDAKVTRYVYDAAARKTSETTPQNETINYTYNPANDLLTLTDGRSKVTTWTYDIEGMVRTKRYHNQSFTNLEYSYDAHQRLAWRKFWSSTRQNKQTLYSYDNAGNLTGIDYPASPDVGFTYNEVNQVATMATTGLGTTTFTYTDAGHPASESGLWAADTVTASYHATAPGLRTGLTVQQPTGSWSQSYGYDAARRLQTVTGPAGTFTYTHKGPGTVWTNLVVPTSPAAAITNVYDTGGRLTGTYLRNNAGTILNQHVYLYNGYGQRQRQSLTDNSYTTYAYDNDAQLSSSLGYTSGGSPVAAEQLTFVYDPGWNMTNRSVNGAPTTYTVNDLNQATGIAGLTANYDANGNRISQVYDANGPKTYTYTYDDENQLLSVATDTYYTPAASRQSAPSQSASARLSNHSRGSRHSLPGSIGRSLTGG